MSKKILKLSAYYEPEKFAELHLEKDLFKTLSENDFQIEMYVSTPTRGVSQEVYEKYKNIPYEEQFNGALKINRFKMRREGKNPISRALRYISCNLKEYRLGIKAKGVDVVYCGSTPPTQGMLSALVAKKLSKKYKKKVPFIFNLQDIFPDSLVYTGLSKKNSLAYKIGSKISNYTYKNADKIIVISNAFKQNLIEKGVSEDKIAIVPNWVDTDLVYPVSRNENKIFSEFGIDNNKFIVSYAGNFGTAQNAEIVLKAAKNLSNYSDIQFVVFGGGVGYDSAVEYVKTNNLINVIINPLLPQERVNEVYSLGNVAVITCKAGSGKSAMPSKTWSIMACNTPIIASYDEDSELAEIIKTSGGGYVAKPSDASALEEAILNSYNDYKKGGLTCSSREYVLKNASKSICVEKYLEIINSVLKQYESFTN